MSQRVLRPRKVVAHDTVDLEFTQHKPAMRTRRAISTIERGPTNNVRFAAAVNTDNWSPGNFRNVPLAKSNGSISSTVPGKSVPKTNARSVPMVKDVETLNTLVATNALLAGQLVEKNKLYQELEQKHIQTLEQSYIDVVEKSELQSKLNEQRIQIEELEKKILEYRDAAFCSDLIRLSEPRKINSKVCGQIHYSSIKYSCLLHISDASVNATAELEQPDGEDNLESKL